MSSSLDQVTTYLRNKIEKVNLNNHMKANTGGILIKTHKGWEDKILRLVNLSLQILETQFSMSNSSNPVGEANLTRLSMSIGGIVAGVVKREPLKDPRHKLALGDLMIEAFVYNGFIEVIPPKRRDSAYILRVTPKWEELSDLSSAYIKDTILGSVKEEPDYPNATILKMHQHLFDVNAPYVRALDKLQKVKWRINDKVLQTILANQHKFVSSEVITDNDAKEQKRLSKIIEWKFITEKANLLNQWDGFYQLFDMDYRGRIYCKEPFLNYQGNDLARGLLQFDEAKEIDERGRFWLSVYTACAFNQSYNIDEIPEWCEEDYVSHLKKERLDSISVDKMTLNDRAEWTRQHMSQIMQVASTSQIQFKAEKPVIFLASCYEWDLIEQTGLTCLPVGIDGSNNGWQHLGAISKDSQTGELVGLIPTEIQKDFYVQTAKSLIKLAKKDEALTAILNKMPMKDIRKGISKRGSMTRAYSAGVNKIAENMYFDCKTEDFHEIYGITLKDCNKFARLLIKAIEQVCPGPLKTMTYLQQLAAYQLGKYKIVGPGSEKDFKALKEKRFELIRKRDLTDKELEELDDLSNKLKEYSYELAYGVGEDKISWVTPSGFITLYEKYTTMDIKPRTTLNGKTIRHVLKAPTDKPDIQGFMCGISPNYIHSMDAAHMVLVIDEWDNKAFGAVHDSFSTHASDVDDLLALTKESFIKIYQHNNYFDEIRNQLTGSTDNVTQPQLGDLSIGGVRESDYFFS